MSKLNIEIGYTKNNDDYAFSGDIKITSNMIYDDRSDDLHTEMSFYKLNEFEDESKEISYDYTSYDPMEDEWNSPEQGVKLYRDLAAKCNLPLFNYDRVTFQESTGTYEASSMVIVDVTYLDISIKFDKNKLVSYSYKYTDGSGITSVTATVKKIGGVEITSPIDYEISKEVFNSYFGSYEDSLDKLNISYTFKETGEPVYVEGEIKLADHLILQDYKLDDDIPRRLFNQFGLNADSNKINVIESYKTADSEWEELVESEKSICAYKDYVYLPLFNFDDFSYNENKGTYDAEHQDYDEAEYADISIKFVNNKLVSWNYVTIDGVMEFDVSCKVTQIGDIEIENPIADKVTESTFNKYFGSYDSIKNMNLSLDYIAETTTGDYLGTIEIADQMVMNSYEDNTSGGKSFRNIVDYDTVNNLVYYNVASANPFDDNWSNLVADTESLAKYKNEFYMPLFDFKNFEYKNGTYVASTITVDDLTYLNISIKFVNGVLHSVYYSSINGSLKTSVSYYVFDVGTTEVKNPFPNSTTKTYFDKYFNIEPEELENLNLTFNYSYGIYTGTLECSDGLRLDTYIRNGDINMTEIYYIDSIDLENNEVNYHYYVLASSWSDENKERNSFETFMANVMYLPKIDFLSLTYNNENGTYDAETITTDVCVLTDVSIKFENNVLVSFEYTRSLYGSKSRFVFEVSKVGETTVVDPRANLE